MGLLTQITTQKLYQIGVQRRFLNLRHFLKWVLFAVIHSLFAYFVPVFLLDGAIDSDGKTLEHWVKSTTSFSICIGIIIMKLFLETLYWHGLLTISLAVTLILYYGVLIIGSVSQVSYIFQPQLISVFQSMLNGRVAICVIFTPFLALSFDLFWNFSRKFCYKKAPQYEALQIKKQKKSMRSRGQSSSIHALKKKSIVTPMTNELYDTASQKYEQQNNQNIKKSIQSQTQNTKQIDKTKVRQHLNQLTEFKQVPMTSLQLMMKRKALQGGLEQPGKAAIKRVKMQLFETRGY